MLSAEFQDEQTRLEEKRDSLREKLDKSVRDSEACRKGIRFGGKIIS